MKSTRFRSRPVEVEAIRWLGEENCAEVFAFAGEEHGDWTEEKDHSKLYIPGLLDTQVAHPGDWLVEGEHEITVMRDAEFTARFEPMPEPEPFDPSTNYHTSVDHFRRDLIAGQAMWHQMTDTHQDGRDDAHKDAFLASLMAGSYSYTLAAILGHAARKYGERVARDLAFEADELLTNGDFEAMNADVIVALAEDAPLPDYITLDPTHGRWGEVPGAHWRCAEHRHNGTWTDSDHNAMAAHADAIAHLDKLHPGWRSAVETAPVQPEIPSP